MALIFALACLCQSIAGGVASPRGTPGLPVSKQKYLLQSVSQASLVSGRQTRQARAKSASQRRQVVSAKAACGTEPFFFELTGQSIYSTLAEPYNPFAALIQPIGRDPPLVTV
ncbi:MAG TPA: hypothetical protein VJQ56_11855 [Blastocatellia bacterium]|nr:hypothetical protein [Blastocatellia bacterium]